ncbi:MAG: hypothetical protein WBC04_20815 [Candidatus Acidiferrales bacterium]
MASTAVSGALNDPSSGLYTVEARHHNVQDGDVWVHSSGLLDGFNAISRLRGNVSLKSRCQQISD